MSIKSLPSPYLPKTKPIAVHKHSPDADFPFYSKRPRPLTLVHFSNRQISPLIPILKQIRLVSDNQRQTNCRLTHFRQLPRPGSRSGEGIEIMQGRDRIECDLITSGGTAQTAHASAL